MIAQCTHKLSATKFHKIHCQTYIVYIASVSHVCRETGQRKILGRQGKDTATTVYASKLSEASNKELIMVPAKTEVVVLVLVFSVLVSRPEVRLYQR